MTTAEKIATKPAGQRIITLKAKHKDIQMTIQPVKDSFTNSYLGIPIIAPIDQPKYAYIPTPKTQIKLVNGVQFDLDDPKGSAHWEIVKHCSEVVESIDQLEENPEAVFYVYEPGEAAEKEIRKVDQLYEALKLINEDSKRNYVKVLRMLGINMTGQSDFDIERRLKEEAKDNPDKVIAAYRDPQQETKLFLYNAIDKGIIRISGGDTTVYSWSGIVIGTSEEAAIGWLGDPANAMDVDAIYSEVYPGTFRPNAEQVEEAESATKRLTRKTTK